MLKEKLEIIHAFVSERDVFGVLFQLALAKASVTRIFFEYFDGLCDKTSIIHHSHLLNIVCCMNLG